MLNKTQVDLIELLNDQKVSSSNYLADCLQVSKRSIISYVKKNQRNLSNLDSIKQ